MRQGWREGGKEESNGLRIWAPLRDHKIATLFSFGRSNLLEVRMIVSQNLRRLYYPDMRTIVIRGFRSMIFVMRSTGWMMPNRPSSDRTGTKTSPEKGWVANPVGVFELFFFVFLLRFTDSFKVGERANIVGWRGNTIYTQCWFFPAVLQILTKCEALSWTQSQVHCARFFR